MAIFNDNERTISLKEHNRDWYTLLQFCVCKVHPSYYKNIRVAYNQTYEEWALYWDSRDGSHTWFYPFPKNLNKNTLRKLKANLPNYITMEEI